MNKPNTKQRLALIIYAGVTLFAILYFYSSMLYPGGSQNDLEAAGFNWFHNYWCDLMGEKAANGLQNPGANYAITALLSLCISMAVFFVLFSKTLVKNLTWKRIIIVSGIISMFNAVLIFSDWHNIMIISSSIFAFIALTGVVRTFYLSSLRNYQWSALFILLVLLVLNVMYYTSYGLYYLPFMQKLAMLFILIWVVSFSMLLSRRQTK